MARVALVQSGKVQHVISAGPDFEVPRGMIAVQSDKANVGDNHDGVNFTPARDPVDASTLSAYAKRRRAAAASRIKVQLPPRPGDWRALVIDIYGDHHKMDLVEMAWLAEQDPTSTFVWTAEAGTSETISADQVLAVKKEVARHVADSHAKLGAVLQAISAGTVTTQDQVDQMLQPKT